MNSSNSFQHCLHPTFTKLLVKRLRERISINLVGKVEHGRSRILEDIQRCDLGEVKVVFLDMKLYRHSYQGFIDELNQQMGFDSDLVQAPKDLTDWMNKIRLHQLKTYILLDGFDSLLSDQSIDENYRSNTFVNKINAMKNHSYLSLICATNEPHKASHFYIESKQVPSPFGLEKELMPSSLSDAKIKAELERQLKGNTFWEHIKKRHNRGIFMTAIRTSDSPYPFLVHLAKRIRVEENTHANISQKIAAWKKEFEQLERPHIDKTIIKGKQTVHRFWENITHQEPNQDKTTPSKSNSSKRPLWLSLFALALIAAVYSALQSNFLVSATSIVLAVILLYKMIFEPQKYQKSTKEMVEFQFFTFVFFVPFVVELKMYSSMIGGYFLQSNFRNLQSNFQKIIHHSFPLGGLPSFFFLYSSMYSFSISNAFSRPSISFNKIRAKNRSHPATLLNKVTCRLARLELPSFIKGSPLMPYL